MGTVASALQDQTTVTNGKPVPGGINGERVQRLRDLI
jgi:hypothetical protein